MVDASQMWQVHEIDVRKARENIRSACEQSSSEWIPSNAIADALLLEYVRHAEHLTSEPLIIRQLEQLIVSLKGRQIPKVVQ